MRASQRDSLGDYTFEDADGEDSADIEQMLQWDVRPVPVYEDDEADDAAPDAAEADDAAPADA